MRNHRRIKSIPTPGTHGYAVEFSPFFPNRLAVASSSNFGIVGNGKLIIYTDFMQPQDQASTFRSICYDTQDGLFDLAWSENNCNLVACACGDGSIRIFDCNVPDFPVRKFAEHGREVFSVNWNLVSKTTFLSSSWDRSIKLWHSEASNINSSISTWNEHQGCVYAAVWSPHSEWVFASCSEDGFVKTWDTRSATSTLSMHASGGEVLTLDWNKYALSGVLVTAGVDKLVKIWDLKFPSVPVAVLSGHEYAIRRLKTSPTNGGVFGTCSYDLTSRLWGAADKDAGGGRQIILDEYPEFAVGIDFSLFEPIVAVCAWDGNVHLYNLEPEWR